ncbi:uncharacterized protein LOC129581339 [Paramacrobiotus metropolitanus]|uniref:uncharacterized protein LOC129581339 n=1 Tax=Paramacrobiotus metropolitanus TaxID=2943436 RepID=UPI002445FCCD|nr:uncharacterized protein LOC129581339 [Paramacrobiotus metropolitanus]
MPTGGAIIVITLSVVLLRFCECAWLTEWHGQPLYRNDQPIEYAFECTDSSIPPDVLYEKVTKVPTAHCSEAIFTSGDPMNATYRVHYTCRQNVTAAPDPMAVGCYGSEDTYCSGCTSTYSAIMCQYRLFSLSRFWSTCVPILDELTKLQPINRADDKESWWLANGTVYTGPMRRYDYYRDPKKEGGAQYCDDGKPGMVISPCCGNPLMVVITDTGKCLQKVICGTSPERIVPFKLNWDITWDYWTGSHIDAWNRLIPKEQHFLNIAMNQLDKCMNATGRVSLDQCDGCMAQPFVKRLFDVGHTVVTEIPLKLN